MSKERAKRPGFKQILAVFLSFNRGGGTNKSIKNKQKRTKNYIL